jgi:hypothetical protein
MTNMGVDVKKDTSSTTTVYLAIECTLATSLKERRRMVVAIIYVIKTDGKPNADVKIITMN